jgi:hypothetical protein
MKALSLPVTLSSARGTVLVTAAAALLPLMAGELSAQSLWTNPAQGRASLELEMLRPNFSDEELVFTGATGAGFLTGRVRLTERWHVVADLPFARAAWDVSDETGTSNTLGNPYLGVEWTQSERFGGELGLRMPLNDVEDIDQLAATLVGMAGELERLEAFMPETLGLYAAGSYRQPLAQALSLRLRANTAFLGGDGGPDDLLVGYTGQLWYQQGRLNVGSGLTGRANVTTDDDEADRASHQWIVAGDYRVGQLRPGLQLRVPLDSDVREVTDFTVGVTLGYSFR